MNSGESTRTAAGATGVGLHVLLARPAESDLLAVLGARTFREAYGDSTPAADLEAFIAATYTPELQAREAGRADAALFVAERAGEAIGFALLDAGTPAPECVAGERAVHLSRIYVIRAAWRTGAGSALLEACLTEARRRGHAVLWLQVWEQNHRALAFYRRHGFERVGTAPFQLGSINYEDPVLALRL